METSTVHQADGGREEEWAESQQRAESQQGIGVTMIAITPNVNFMSLVGVTFSAMQRCGY
ncbi:hypothetical protein EYF80_020617 [Liparis tanakae]|uniref:Uncharacterized protein n=1 Tax=Liparis tanakae TaxID=230148 RepID=A0A4Z2HU24_9TELE|nr:hypothetical protein EYF80_020617 [Liparis tanakae]